MNNHEGGYDFERGMSNRAVAAYKSGRIPISKLKKSDLKDNGLENVTVKFAKWLAKNEYWMPSEWHHTGGTWYNSTDFYNVEQLAEMFNSGALDIDELLQEFKEDTSKNEKPVKVKGRYTQWKGKGKRKTKKIIKFTGEKLGNWIYMNDGKKKKADGNWISYSFA